MNNLEKLSNSEWLAFYQKFNPWIVTRVRCEWYRQNRGRVIGRGYALEETNEAIQDVYLRLLKTDQRALRTFQTDSLAFAYLNRVCVTTVISRWRYYRAAKRRARLVSLECCVEGQKGGWV